MTIMIVLISTLNPFVFEAPKIQVFITFSPEVLRFSVLHAFILITDVVEQQGKVSLYLYSL